MVDDLQVLRRGWWVAARRMEWWCGLPAWVPWGLGWWVARRLPVGWLGNGNSK